jgi:hypothetical protein
MLSEILTCDVSNDFSNAAGSNRLVVIAGNHEAF